MTKRGRTAIVAVGGNALIIDEEHQSIPDQSKAAAESSHYVADMVEAGWSIVNPVMDIWKALPPRNFPNYPSGTWGPKESDELMERDGRRWRNFEK